ncbi:MAG TPA: ABC transporter substrate-binding protein [Gammaproteobacteria bacterium]|nr:ABC transporter substrate-binding protein [Gammaproteobacteria bacterium]
MRSSGKSNNLIQSSKNKILSLAFTFLLSFITCPSISIAEPLAQKTIGISQIVEHPALDAVRESMLTALKAEGYEAGKNLKVIYDNAQGNIVTSTQIANKLMSSKINLAVGISTPSAQTLFYEGKKHASKIPIVFSAVSDPKAAGLEACSDCSITGVTDTAHLEGLIELIKSLMPQLKILGLMYNAAETNSVSTINRLKTLLKKNDIHFIEVTVNKTQDVADATKSLIGKVDALYFPQDNTLVSAIQTIVNIASQSSPTLPVILPIFTSDPLLVQSGVLAAVGYDYHDIGRETGSMVAKILNGENPKHMPTHNPSTLKAFINSSVANRLGLEIPAKLDFAEIHVTKDP